MGETHAYCRKEKEIAEMHTDLQTIKRIVMGNGTEGLSISVPKLAQSVDRLEKTSVGLDISVQELLRFQENQDGYELGKENIRKRNRWLIGLLVTIDLGLLGALFALIAKV